MKIKSGSNRAEAEACRDEGKGLDKSKREREYEKIQNRNVYILLKLCLWHNQKTLHLLVNIENFSSSIE